MRLNAIRRGFLLDENVTPQALKDLTGTRCPVSLQNFDFKKPGSPNNPSVDRIINDGTYALGNLLVVTQRVNRAKGDRSFHEVLEIAQRGNDAFGLRSSEWTRLCALMYGAWTSLNGGEDCYLIPLATYLPRYAFFPTSHAVQLLLLESLEARYREDAFEYWKAVTVEACGTASLFIELHTALSHATETEDHWPSVWLRKDVFNTFAAWYIPCRDSVNRAVEPSLRRQQASYNLGATLAAWKVGELSRRESPN